ncbi:iron uptake transporter deferrochelatase/peroxidase subunit [Ktedonobacter racemifer]|uniref:Deferrochelatase n=1 Tax=Ktedonobacter racemifer DSM 44963 TaxID=485913 RepID=D6U518_KTERA|nr:iron uptake transporter deferrochelatase/peroxidase subunit [Ktedonobacter racemifer]EFH81598.1 Dyp-type peroxidase family [Ktedonobacter racemifer DSM 44963]
MSEKTGQKFNRRNMLISASAAGAGLVLGGGGGYALAHTQGQQAMQQTSNNDIISFYGEKQAGITTPQQDHLHFAAFNLTTQDSNEVASLLRIWTVAAAAMTSGKPIGEGAFPDHAPPPDTGEALGLPAANLTITFGFGPTLFTKDGKDRYGLAARRPEALVDLPSLPGDALDPTRSGGDLCVQACSDNPLVAFHAVRNLARQARGLATIRWSQLGFNRTASTSTQQETPRNLMGFKDGTNNLKVEDPSLMDQHVWAGNEAASWMHGGSYLVARRIRMHLESWDRDFLADQEKVFGRRKVSGAPLTGKQEFDAVDLTAKHPDGTSIIATNAHIRLAREDDNIRILRRGYSFTDGMDKVTGELDAGLFFIAFQRDPRKQFIPLQQKLGQRDLLNEYITHNGSAIFACPPGTQPGGFIGETLFA